VIPAVDSPDLFSSDTQPYHTVLTSPPRTHNLITQSKSPRTLHIPTVFSKAKAKVSTCEQKHLKHISLCMIIILMVTMRAQSERITHPAGSKCSS
jgi:hypothetical protein